MLGAGAGPLASHRLQPETKLTIIQYIYNMQVYIEIIFNKVCIYI